MQSQRHVLQGIVRGCSTGSSAQQSTKLQMRHQTSGSSQQAGKAAANGAAAGSEAESTPPSALAAMATMGAGAFGAVAIAAVGVWGVFKMAMAVAEGTGRSLNSQGSTPAASGTYSQPTANDLLPMQPDVPSGPLYPPTPAVRKADLQAELQALYQMPKSRAVEEQKAAISKELQLLS